jgi:thiamine pyrophosphate-dependent acetolactate synthase large subunit-like protein
MYNNRAYHQEVMYVQNMAARRSRGMDRVGIGTALDSPHIDFAQMARSMGVYAEGPITDPKDLRGAIKRALAVVKRGEPALIDAVVEPR